MKNVMNMTPEHWFFVPAVLVLGIVIGFLWGQSHSIEGFENSTDRNSNSEKFKDTNNQL
jgi:hypothetical protein